MYRVCTEYVVCCTVALLFCASMRFYFRLKWNHFLKMFFKLALGEDALSKNVWYFSRSRCTCMSAVIGSLMRFKNVCILSYLFQDIFRWRFLYYCIVKCNFCNPIIISSIHLRFHFFNPFHGYLTIKWTSTVVINV